MSKIMFEGKEYEDCLYCDTTIRISFLQRVKNLFCPYIQFKLSIYTEQTMPKYKVDRHIRTISYWTQFKTFLRLTFRKHHGLVEIPKEETK